jgi:hypothetical protein
MTATLTTVPTVTEHCSCCDASYPQGSVHDCKGKAAARRWWARWRAETAEQERRELAALRPSRVIGGPRPTAEQREWQEMRNEILKGLPNRTACDRCGQTNPKASHGLAHVCVRPLDPAQRRLLDEQRRIALAANPLAAELAELRSQVEALKADR